MTNTSQPINGPAAWLEITHLRLTLPRLGPAFNRFRVVQISDIHLGTWMDRERLDQVVDAVNRQGADVVAVTGDFVHRNPERTAVDLIASLSRLQARVATLAVMGNHDHHWGAELVAEVIDASGMIHLSNAVFAVQRGPSALFFGGVDCYYFCYDRLDLVLEQLPQSGAAILLAHEPDFADISARTGRFDLQLSGHSHGGQVILPVLGALFLPRGARKYPFGFYRINGMMQYTNRGLGTSHLSVRINCPPEITVIDLIAPGVSPSPQGQAHSV